MKGELHQRFMRTAVEEAKRALGRTHPNPAVGAVIVKKGRVIATGYHAKAGTPHAEVVALAQAGKQARGATLYSTLEPCNHFGRTPPCTEAIISAGIKTVVFGSSDPNPLVNGKGKARLKRAGIEVVSGVLAAETDALNEPFFKAVTTGLPWVTLKAGVTLDGKLATASGESKWITSQRSRDAAHHLRDRADAVLVGATTVDNDDPELTTRIAGGRNAIRVVFDPRLSTDPAAKIYRCGEGLRTIVVTLESPGSRRAKKYSARGVEVWQVAGEGRRFALEPLLRQMVKAGILHLLVEGGANVHASFLEAGLADELVLFVAPKLFGHSGVTWSGLLDVPSPAKAVQLQSLRSEQIGEDVMLVARFAQRL